MKTIGIDPSRSHAPGRGEAEGTRPAAAGDFQGSEANIENLSASVESSERPSVVNASSQRAVDGDGCGIMAVASVDECFWVRDGKHILRLATRLNKNN